MVILIAFLLVLLFAGLGFALHFVGIAAAVLFVLWLVGFGLGRGESCGTHRVSSLVMAKIPSSD